MSAATSWWEGRREGLQLSLNRSLSEPGPPKRCRLETASLPTSPCLENTLRRSLVLAKLRRLSPDQLADRLDTPSAPLLLDLRPFIAYNVSHIRGSINVSCSDRISRRRLEAGKAALADLAVSRRGKELLRKRNYKEVVVYDESSTELDRLPDSHPLFLVIAALVDDQRDPVLLIATNEILLESTIPVFISWDRTTPLIPFETFGFVHYTIYTSHTHAIHDSERSCQYRSPCAMQSPAGRRQAYEG